MLKGLRVKFVCFTMAIVTVMLCVIFGTVYTFTARSLETASLQMMQELALDPFRPGRLNGWDEELRLPYFVVQTGLRGEFIAAGGGYFDLSDREYIQEIINTALASQEQSGVLKEYGLRYYRESSRTALTIVFADMSSEQGTLNNLLESCAVIGVLSFLAFLAMSLLLARWATGPVERAWQQQRQFVADASHELKTPLTVILTNAELLQSGGGTEEQARFSASILKMARQMRGLVESLLELARLDSAARPSMEAVDLSGLMAEVLLPFEPLYFEQGLELRADIEPGVLVNGCESQLRQVAEILLDNARKYAAPASPVELRLERRGGRCQLSVASRGEALSPEDLKNIFKRFYRGDKARGMNHSYGLGLAIAESIVREHKGKIWAESARGVNTFYVELPI